MAPRPIIASWNDDYPIQRKLVRFTNSADTTDSDRDTDSGHAGSSIGESDETASCAESVLSSGEFRPELERPEVGSAVYELDHLMPKFCINELEPEDEDTFDSTKILGRTFGQEKPIVSRTGSMRGYRGRVKAAVSSFTDTSPSKNYEQLEKGKVVLYTTSLAICRGPFLKCLEARKILQNMMIKYTECDLYISRTHQVELRERVGPERAENVPHLFVEGHHVGDYDTILDLNESGQLRTMLKPYKRYGIEPPCQQCGGFAYHPCTVCFGSKKSSHRNAFTDQFYALRCVACDKNGLVQCSLCVLDRRIVED